VVAVWPALGVAVVGVVAGLITAIVRGLRSWRRLKGLSRAFGNGVADVSTRAEEIETHLTRASEGSEQLSASLERLRRSRARLNVQLAAVREARAAVERELPFLGGR
jgi:chromosome segregation ATPase